VPILKAIQEWSPSLPTWQQDAASRLFSKGTLDAQDYEDLCALLKSAHGIPDPLGRTAKQLLATQVPATQSSTPRVRLLAIKDLQNVNALAPDQSLRLAPEGITAIYGGNGSGKSGYSRVLKRACRARDQSEEILPDARLPKTSSRVPCAKFEINIGDEAVELEWINGATAPEALSSIAIFDTHCARAYIDNEDDFSFVPYGLDILEGLAKACNRLKTMLDMETAGVTVNSAPYEKLISDKTKVGKLLTNLSIKTTPSEVEVLSNLTQVELARHAALEKGLREENPLEKSRQLTLRSGRLSKLSERCRQKQDLISDERFRSLKELILSYRTAQSAADLAAKQFKEAAGHLPGTGGDAWKLLFDAARNFCAESHPDRTFPHLGAEAACPLCQQPLGNAAERLVSFDRFLQQEAEKLATQRKRDAKVAYDAMMTPSIDLGFDSELRDELAASNPEIAQTCDSLALGLDRRRLSLKAACAPSGDWSAIDGMPPDPCPALDSLVATLQAELKVLADRTDEKELAALESEFRELDARKQLSAVKESVLGNIRILVLQSKLRACQSSVRTTAISNKSSELVQKVVSKGLAEALNREFAELRVNHLKVAVRSSTVKAKTKHKLVLELPGAASPTDILSEGEQRAVAVASFLAEVNLGDNGHCIVFDDPVSSLDHKRRELVAQRLVAEARRRQVVIFTHDLYFLSLLQLEAAHKSVPLRPMSLRQSASGYGVTSDDLPFDGAGVKVRIGMLKQRQVELKKLHKLNEEESYAQQTRVTYQRLRDTWERAVEEALLNGVVWRFKAGVSTQSLREVAVEDADYTTIQENMSKCSRFAHDGAAGAQVSIPGPDDVMKDISALEAWFVGTINRRETLKKNRPKYGT
jgi:energy-coupling factor transporter ATP-binding protein EcfA2